MSLDNGKLNAEKERIRSLLGPIPGSGSGRRGLFVAALVSIAGEMIGEKANEWTDLERGYKIAKNLLAIAGKKTYYQRVDRMLGKPAVVRQASGGQPSAASRQRR